MSKNEDKCGAICGARPRRGNGTLWCTKPPLHRGLHEGDGSTFSRIIPGSSARAKKNNNHPFAKVVDTESSEDSRGKLTGRHFGRWTVLRHDIVPKRAIVQCSCPRQTTRSVLIESLLLFRSKSCGCVAAELATKRAKHDRSFDTEYRIWRDMIRRCYDHRYCRYSSYGARGIQICSRWRNNFSDFLLDMGKRPSPKHSIDRRDNSGHYSCGLYDLCNDCRDNEWPSNCHWATWTEQNQNRSVCRTITYNGQAGCLAEMSRRYGFKRNTVFRRLKAGWSIERALTTPV